MGCKSSALLREGSVAQPAVDEASDPFSDLDPLGPRSQRKAFVYDNKAYLEGKRRSAGWSVLGDAGVLGGGAVGIGGGVAALGAIVLGPAALVPALITMGAGAGVQFAALGAVVGVDGRLWKHIREGTRELRFPHLAFLSYHQGTCGAIVASFGNALHALGSSYSGDAFDKWHGTMFRDAEMLRDLDSIPFHVQQSRVYVGFLSKEFFSSPFCLLEFISAVTEQKPIILIESDCLLPFDRKSILAYKAAAQATRTDPANRATFESASASRADWDALFRCVESTISRSFLANRGRQAVNGNVKDLMDFILAEAKESRALEFERFSGSPGTRYREISYFYVCQGSRPRRV